MNIRIRIVGLDADDTLWANMPFFTRTEQRFCELLSAYGDAATISREQYRTEVDNMRLYGFGTKSFTLSMIETALRLSEGALPPAALAAILDLGKQLLDHPLQVLDGVEETLAALRRSFTLVIATKGDLLEQERKLEKSGLKHYFHHVEIMSDKTGNDYAALLSRLGAAPEEFAMIGNSVKSDVCPVLALGGYAVHVPFHDTWVHEQAEPPLDHPRYYGAECIVQALKAPFLQP